MRKLNERTFSCPDYKAERIPGVFEEFDEYVKAAVCRVKGQRYSDLKALIDASVKVECNAEFVKYGDDDDVVAGAFLLVLS